MAYALLDTVIGSQSVSNFFAPDTVQRQVLGTKVIGADNYWGGGEFIYLKATATPVVIRTDNFGAENLALNGIWCEKVTDRLTANNGI